MNAEDMLLNPFSFKLDAEDILFFNGILFILVKHYDSSKREAITMINEYYDWHETNSIIGADGETWLDRLGHDDIYIAAARIYYRSLGLPKDQFYDWLKRIDSLKSADETFRMYNELLIRVRMKLANS